MTERERLLGVLSDSAAINEEWRRWIIADEILAAGFGDVTAIQAERDESLAVVAAIRREHSTTSLTRWPSGVSETCDGCHEFVPCPTSVLAAEAAK